ncbi:MAG: hypothetical protein L0Y42_03585 [Phycisphaerales bacterium]|nr:hypothetical protein [Phycisphaerales bacterium]
MRLIHGWTAHVALGGAMIAALCAASSAGAGLVDQFNITLKQTVSNGVPGEGAGNIEVGGASDIYLLELIDPTLVYFDEISASTCSLLWKCEAPDLTMLFNNNAMCIVDPASILLNQVGTYTITVYGSGPAVTGTYSFALWQVNATEVFEIALEQVVSNGSPAAGAGNIEEPGAMDQYNFEGSAGTLVYFDEISAANCSLLWRCETPGGALLFNNNNLCTVDPGSMTLPETGTYTIEAYTIVGATGTYSFTIWESEPPDVFSINLKQTVSNGVPGLGAGNIEEPGAFDQYTFAVEPGTLVYFDELSSANCSLLWKCTAPDSTVLFNNNNICTTDPGSFLLEQTGDYTITAYTNNGATGTYSFVLNEVNPTQTFALELEQTVSDGVPEAGAGNIEEPAAIDEYLLTINRPTLVFFDGLDAGCALQWKCIAPDETEVFGLTVLCTNDPGTILLTQTGDYVIRVSGSGGATGTYSFIVWEVNSPDVFPIDLDEVVSVGIPGPGAGNIEEPGAIDQYILTAEAGASACFEALDADCSLRWEARDPNGRLVFTDPTLCVGNPGKFALEIPGDYTVSVSGNSDGLGVYSIIIHTGRPADLSGDCTVNVVDLLALIATWGACPDPLDCPADVVTNGAVDVNDLLAVIADWG